MPAEWVSKATLAPEDDGDFVTLDEACRIVFGDKVGTSTLRAQADRGNLTIFRVGRRDFTTVRLVREMVQKCRVAKPRRDSASTEAEEHGQLETARITSARDALSQTLQALKQSSGPTLAPSTNRRGARPH